MEEIKAPVEVTQHEAIEHYLKVNHDDEEIEALRKEWEKHKNNINSPEYLLLSVFLANAAMRPGTNLVSRSDFEAHAIGVIAVSSSPAEKSAYQAAYEVLKNGLAAADSVTKVVSQAEKPVSAEVKASVNDKLDAVDDKAKENKLIGDQAEQARQAQLDAEKNGQQQSNPGTTIIRNTGISDIIPRAADALIAQPVKAVAGALGSATSAVVGKPIKKAVEFVQQRNEPIEKGSRELGKVRKEIGKEMVKLVNAETEQEAKEILEKIVTATHKHNDLAKSVNGAMRSAKAKGSDQYDPDQHSRESQEFVQNMYQRTEDQLRGRGLNDRADKLAEQGRKMIEAIKEFMRNLVKLFKGSEKKAAPKP